MTSRRAFLTTVAGGLGLAARRARAASRAAVVTAPALPAPRAIQNLLFISIDDINDWVGVLGGHPDVLTPNIDRLAASGVAFQRAYTPSPICSPARMGVETGLHTITHGVRDNLTSTLAGLAALPSVVPLVQHFRNNGWRTMSAGKFYFDRPADGLDEAEAFDEFLPQLPDPVPEDPDAWGILDVPDSAMGDYAVAEWVAERLRAPQEAPFFLACGLFRPHLPWYVPRSYFDLYPLDSITLPPVLDTDLGDVPPVGRRMAKEDQFHNIVEAGDWLPSVRAYLASISFADAMVGRVLDALEAGPHAETTAVVLWSDNGWHLGEKLHWRKFALWEEANRIPLVVRVPGLTPPGFSCMRTVSLLDLYPTFLTLFGLPPLETPLDGHDLAPLLADPSAPWEWPAVSIYTFEGTDHVTVRSERWRYIRYADGTEELYDHDADPLEWRNVAGLRTNVRTKGELAAHIPHAHPLRRRPLGTRGLAATEAHGERVLADREVSARPNPSSGAVALGFHLSSEATLTLQVLDMRGREVYRRPLGRLAAGRHDVVWEGTGEGGRPLPSGSYICRLHGPGYSEARRVLLLR